MAINKVTVCIYGGQTAEKILVEDCGEVLLVTTEDEWRASERDGRPPITVGFKREYLVKSTA